MVEEVPKEVVLAARAGDGAAWERLVRATEGPLVRFLFSRVRDDATARDLAQEVWVAALASLGSLGEPWHLHGWLRRIAARKVARHLEARARIPLAASPVPDVPGRPPPRDLSDVLDRLERLPPRHREVLRLFYLEELSVADVAGRLAVASGTVKRRLHEGRRKMAKREAAGAGADPRDDRRRAVPAIAIRERPGETATVELSGPLVPYGSFLEPGDVEIFDGYHYPGGLWAERSESEVLRRIRIGDLDAVEVRVAYLGDDRSRWAFDEGAAERMYFHRDATGIRALLRISRESPSAPLVVEDRPIADDPYPAGPTTGPVFDVTIDGRARGPCVRLRHATPDTAAEWYLTPAGRCVLMRRYNGPAWENYDDLARSPTLALDGTEYRLWHDTVLKHR